ncbi:serine/threonine protein phosphatase [Wukongibacter baidiensis]|uniref:PP2C family protein-serine/threonine phosphatase n=1 Tax=Wukongibacter baidiensis TaxID=1723361 RepID=UPI003D7F9F6B
MRKMNSKIRTKFVSESGSYLQNKDYFAFVELDRYAIYVIADGIDNDKDLNSSKLAVKQIISSFTEHPTMGKRGLRKLLIKANEELRKESLKEALKASVTIVVTNYVKCRYALVGNTRFNLFRDGYVKYESKDQSLTQELLKEEKVSLDKAAKHEERNNLYCYLGQKERLTPFISKAYRMKSGDTITLYTRGVWENLYKSELLDGLSEIADPEEGINNIEELIMSKQLKDLDNYTIAIIFIDKIYENPKLKKTIKKVIVISIIIIMLLSILGFFLYKKHKTKLKNIEDMDYYRKNAMEYIRDNNYLRAKEEYTEALKLAKKLESGEDRSFIDKRIKLMESIIEADVSLENKEYSEAVDKYLIAKNKAYYLDNIGLEYIYENLEETKSYILVSDLLMEADKKFEIGDLSGSQEAYIKARDLARSLYYKEAKDEAVQRLEQIYELNQKNKEQQDEDRENQKLEQDEINKQKIALQESAIQAYKDANSSYKIGDYPNAKLHYEIALLSYKELNMTQITKQIEKRLLDVENKLTDAKAEEYKASQYEKSGDEEFNNNNLQRAKMLYILSKDIYNELELEEDANRVIEKIEGIDPLIPSPGI